MPMPPKPLQVILGNGKMHLSKAEIKERQEKEIKVDKGNVEAPCYLNNKQKEKYDQLKEELLKVDLISNLDVDLLARYVILYDEFLNVTKALENEEITVKIDGQSFYNSNHKELLNAQTKLTKEIRGVATDLGLSVGARLKLTIPKPEKEENKERSEGEKLFGDII